MLTHAGNSLEPCQSVLLFCGIVTTYRLPVQAKTPVLVSGDVPSFELTRLLTGVPSYSQVGLCIVVVLIVDGKNLYLGFSCCGAFNLLMWIIAAVCEPNRFIMSLLHGFYKRFHCHQ